jgi:2-polyprenyl-3-methyl-5-hydroxy-6-metoxy-1,4-benzoquinol methylase
MKEQQLKFYDEFHKKTTSPVKLPEENNYTYEFILKALKKLNIKKGENILDFGCGSGLLSYYIAHNYDANVLGIDISSKVIDEVKNSPLFCEKTEFLQGDIFSMKINRKFDKIICVEVLEHVENDENLLNVFYKILKPGGALFLTTPLKSQPLHRIRMKLFGFDSFDLKVGHLRRYSQSELIKIMEKQRFNVQYIEKTEGFLRSFLFTTKIGNFILRQSSDIIKNLFRKIDKALLHLLGPCQIIIIAVKR